MEEQAKAKRRERRGAASSRSNAFYPLPAPRPLGSSRDSGGARQREARSPGLGSREQSCEPEADAGARRPFPAGSGGVKAREQSELAPPPPAASRLWKYDLK